MNSGALPNSPLQNSYFEERYIDIPPWDFLTPLHGVRDEKLQKKIIAPFKCKGLII